MIVEYKLNKENLSQDFKPASIKSGGHFYDPDNYTRIGFLDSDHEHKLPDSIRVIAGAVELKERCQNLHGRYPFIDIADGTSLTTGEVDTLVDDTISAHDIGGAGTPSKVSTSQESIDDTDSPYSLRHWTRTLLIDANTASVTVNIPTAVGCKGLRFTFINSTDSAANTVTLDGAGTEKLNGSETNTALDAQFDNLTIESNGVDWLIVG